MWFLTRFALIAKSVEKLTEVGERDPPCGLDHLKRRLDAALRFAHASKGTGRLSGDDADFAEHVVQVPREAGSLSLPVDRRSFEEDRRHANLVQGLEGHGANLSSRRDRFHRFWHRPSAA